MIAGAPTPGRERTVLEPVQQTTQIFQLKLRAVLFAGAAADFVQQVACAAIDIVAL